VHIPANPIGPVAPQGAEALQSSAPAGAAAPSAPQAPAETRAAESAVLSPHAADFAVAQRALEQTDAVRWERVAELRRRMAEGTYRVDSEAVAEALLGRR